MKKEAFQLLHEAENSWWYKGRSLAIRATLARTGIKGPIDSILDFGAGFGGMHRELARLSSHVDAFEPDANAQAVTAQQGYAKNYTSTTDALSKQYGLIALFDVVEHIEDDETFVASLQKSLTSRGLLLITVPAFPFLWSKHDVDHHHFRRYTKRSLSKLLSKTGYEIVSIGFWDTLLFLPAAAVRLLGLSGSSALTTGGFIDAIFLGIVTLESKILRFISLPFGVSLIVIARKRSS